MDAFWTQPDFDDHELVQFVHDRASGLTAIIALHSTHLGPGAGGTRFWHYANPGDAMRDALRLSRGMSYKNAMAGLPLGGGKSVILADAKRTKTPDMLHAFGKAVDHLCGRYVTAEDVGMSVSDISGKAIANLATEELSHPAPVFHGDTLFAETEVLEVRESRSKPDRGTVKVHTRVLNQDGALVAEFKRLVLVPRKNPT